VPDAPASRRRSSGQDPHRLPATGAWSRREALLLPLTVLAIGLLSIALLALTNRWQRRAAHQDTAVVRLVGEVQANTAIVHLWLEEFVSGDQVDLEEVDRLLARCAELTAALLGDGASGQAAAAALELEPLREPGIRGEAERLAAVLEEFEQISRDRVLGFQRGLAVGIGSAFDVEYDRVFAELLRRTRLLERSLHAQRERNRERDSRSFLGLLLAWGLVLALASFGLWSRERRRREAEVALGDSEARLQRAQKLDAVGRLAGGLAHDINNYLAAIRSQSELLAGKSDDPRVQQKMELVLGTVDKASTLIERLLAFSRRQPARREAIDWNRLIESLLPVLAATCGPQVRVRPDLESELWPVLGDPAQLEQILLNLVVNANDALAGRDNPAIEIRTRNQPHPQGDRVLLAVADNGAGIPPELVDRIFEPFFSTKGRDSNHSGLGLSSVYGIVQQSGGLVDLRSQVGAGTTFEIVLPRAFTEA
jgi:signal transduction histidine kinase